MCAQVQKEILVWTGYIVESSGVFTMIKKASVRLKVHALAAAAYRPYVIVWSLRKRISNQDASRHMLGETNREQAWWTLRGGGRLAVEV